MPPRPTQLIPLTLTLHILSACASADDGCIWEERELLRHVGARVADTRVDCGIALDGGTAANFQPLLDCFQDAPSQQGARLTLGHCIDCFSITNFYSTPRSEIFAIDRASSTLFGDPPRRSRISRCTSLAFEVNTLRCTAAQELYSCEEPPGAYTVPKSLSR